MLAAVPTFKGKIDVWEVDMASFDSVRSFAKRIRSDLDRLDIFLLNAGIQAHTWRVTNDGYEEALAAY